MSSMVRQLFVRTAPRLWASVAISAIALGLFVRSVWPVTPLTELDGFAAAVATLEAGHDAGSVVVVWPPEQHAALAALPPALRATSAVPVEPPSQRRVLRVLLVGPAPLDRPPELRAATLVRQQRFAEVEVQVYSYEESDRADFDLRQDLGEVSVRLAGPELNLTCDTRRPDGGWGCPGQPEWNHVAPTTLNVEGQPWPCLWAHPRSGHQLVFDLGPRRLWDAVEIEAALSDEAAATPAGASVLLRLELDGVESRRLVRTNARGVVRANVATVRGEEKRVRLLVDTAQDGRRHLGVNLRILERRAGGSTRAQ